MVTFLGKICLLQRNNKIRIKCHGVLGQPAHAQSQSYLWVEGRERRI